VENIEIDLMKRLAKELPGGVTQDEWATVRYKGLLKEYLQDYNINKGHKEGKDVAWSDFKQSAFSLIDAIRFHQDYDPQDSEKEDDSLDSAELQKEPVEYVGSDRTSARTRAIEAYNHLHSSAKTPPFRLGLGATVFPGVSAGGPIPQLVCLLWTDLQCSPEEVSDHYRSVQKYFLEGSIHTKGSQEANEPDESQKKPRKKRASRIPERTFDLARFVWETELEAKKKVEEGKNNDKLPRTWNERKKAWNDLYPIDESLSDVEKKHREKQRFKSKQSISQIFDTAKKDILGFRESLPELIRDWIARGQGIEIFDAWAARFRQRL
jgi:hypothetical protein